MANTSGSVYLVFSRPSSTQRRLPRIILFPVVVAPITVVSTATGAIAGIQPLFSPYIL
jgi:hypothetical protein